jgi:hypothetical protein
VEDQYKIIVLGYTVEIFNCRHWSSSEVRIYDFMQLMTEAERDSIIEYVYNEGFIEDRRVLVKIIKY